MYCRKCDKTLPADSTFCPYCGNEKLEADPVTEEAPVEETPVEAPATEAEATAEETAEATEAEATAEETAEAPEAAEVPVTAPDGDKVVEGKSGKGAIIVLSVLVCVMVAVCAFLAGRLLSDKPAETTEAPVTTVAPETTAAPVTEDLFPAEYTTAYPDGYAYGNEDLSKYVTLGTYKGLTATLTISSEITDADVADYIDGVLAQYTTEQTVDRPAAEGDIVVIDYVGTKDGVEFEGGKASDQTLASLGTSGYIPGFESGIVGMKAGETKVIDVTFPADYHSADLAGAAAQFTITLDAVKEKVVPEYNDAFVREHFDYSTMPEYEAYVRTVLSQNREMEILTEKQEAVLSQAVDNAKVIAFPENLVEDYMFQQIDYVRQYAAMYQMEYTDFTEQVIGMQAGAYEAEVRASAEDAVKQELVMYAIAAAEGLTPTDEELAEAEAYYLQYYGAEDIASLCETVGVTETYFQNTIHFSVTYANVMDFLTENATFQGAK